MHNVAEIVKGAWYHDTIKFMWIGAYGLVHLTT